MMEESVKLNIAEKMLLLSYIREKERISYRVSGTIQYALTAVSLFELCMKKKLGIEGRKVVVLDMSPTGDEILDGMLAKISEKYNPRTVAGWITALSHGSMKKLLNRLVDKGVFWEDYATWFIWFSRKCYRLSEEKGYAALHENLRNTLLASDERFTAEEMMIVEMAKNINILPMHLDKDELRRCKGRLKSLTKNVELAERVMGSELAQAYKAINKALVEVKAATSAG